MSITSTGTAVVNLVLPEARDPKTTTSSIESPSVSTKSRFEFSPAATVTVSSLSV